MDTFKSSVLARVARGEDPRTSEAIAAVQADALRIYRRFIHDLNLSHANKRALRREFGPLLLNAPRSVGFRFGGSRGGGRHDTPSPKGSAADSPHQPQPTTRSILSLANIFDAARLEIFKILETGMTPGL